MVSFVTQLRDYSREQQELVSGLLRDAGREPPVQLQHTADAAAAAAAGQQPVLPHPVAAAAAGVEGDPNPAFNNGAAVGTAEAEAGAAQHSSGGSSPAGKSPADGRGDGPGDDGADIDRPSKRVKQDSELV